VGFLRGFEFRVVKIDQLEGLLKVVLFEDVAAPLVLKLHDDHGRNSRIKVNFFTPLAFLGRFVCESLATFDVGEIKDRFYVLKVVNLLFSLITVLTGSKSTNLLIVPPD
jgi:hypothetical protein